MSVLSGFCSHILILGANDADEDDFCYTIIICIFIALARVIRFFLFQLDFYELGVFDIVDTDVGWSV